MLGTIDDLIDALGGTTKVAAFCGVGLSAVSNWRSRRRIPAELFFIFEDKLKTVGKKADPSLFTFASAEAAE